MKSGVLDERAVCICPGLKTVDEERAYEGKRG
jgi:hypothetical protein